MRTLTRFYVVLIIIQGLSNVAHAEIVTVSKFLQSCETDRESCISFVFGVVEGARQQVRERYQSQPFSYTFHGDPVCLPVAWGSVELTERVISTLSQQPETFKYSAVSGVLYALSTQSKCERT